MTYVGVGVGVGVSGAVQREMQSRFEMESGKNGNTKKTGKRAPLNTAPADKQTTHGMEAGRQGGREAGEWDD